MKDHQDRNTMFSPLRRIKWLPFLLIAFLSLHLGAYGQQLRVDADQEALNQVLIRLVEEYGIRISFDDRLLSQYPVTVHREFPTADAAIAHLLEPLPLEFRIIDDTYLIRAKRTGPVPVDHLLAGRITDRFSGESLPHTHLVINARRTTTDFSGHFSYASDLDSVYEVSVSHLGYYSLDTLLKAGHGHVIGLVPSVYQLEEVDISGSIVERSGQSVEEAGALRLNHKVAYRLPGNGDDAIFNFLRLQPGIMAAGEQSSEMIIWGGYSGNSHLLFDGFTIFGPRNFNDNISFVNPYMTKEIRLLKGGYSAEYGERVEGIVEVTGIEGDRQKPSLNININNMTISAMAGVPVREKAALTLAFRHTYYNLYGPDDLGLISGRSGGDPGSGIDVTVFPDYRFRDGNIKFAGSTGKGDPYFISLYSGGDLFAYEFQELREITRIEQEALENSRQMGGTAFFGRTWRKGVRSNFSLSYSGLYRELSERREIYRIDRDLLISFDESQFRSGVSELSFRNSNYMDLWKKHRLQAGVGYVYYSNFFLQDQEDLISSSGVKQESRINIYFQDEYRPAPSLSLKPGVRIDYPVSIQKMYIQPRFQISVEFAENWSLNGAWGLYNQFIAETSILDDLGNYRYFWIICDNDKIPVLQAQHLVGGIIYQGGGLSLSIEPFFKSVRGITRLIATDGEGHGVYQGQARIFGTDLLLKKYFGRHEGWLSYTLGKAEEHFSYFSSDDYADAPQDQRHEIKAAVLLDFKPFFFSVNYVYGSGLAYYNFLYPGTEDRYPYSRLDAAFIYRLKLERVRMETGISLMNILNRENIKYSNLFEVPDGQFSSISVHAEAMPFTPTLYLNLAF